MTVDERRGREPSNTAAKVKKIAIKICKRPPDLGGRRPAVGWGIWRLIVVWFQRPPQEGNGAPHILEIDL